MSIDALLRMSEARQEPPDPALEELAVDMLFHRLNNQLGVVLAHAELLEAKAPDAANHARSALVVRATLDAMTLARAVRSRLNAL